MTRIASGPDKIHAALKKLKNESTAKELELIELVASLYEAMEEKKEQVVDKVKDTTTTVNTSVHLHPWRYIGGALAIGIIAGCFFHRHKS